MSLILILDAETLVGFACGYILHLSCLMNYDDESFTGPKLSTEDSGSVSTLATRSVGDKVTHARILKDNISGCPICRGTEAVS